jgi:excisionase family DNA binding protein
MAINTSESPGGAIPRRKNEAPAPAPLAYSVRDAMAVSGLGRSTIFSLMAEGRLGRVKIGRKTLIPRGSLEALLSGEAA